MSAEIVRDAVLSSAQAHAGLIAEFGAEIDKGMPKMSNISEIGNMLRIIFTASEDDGRGIPGHRVLSTYGFIVLIAFFEPDAGIAEDRKLAYDKLIRDWVDNDLSFGSVCLETTILGRLDFDEQAYSEGYYFCTAPLACQKYEIAGNR